MGDMYGFSTCISGDGMLFAVGAPYATNMVQMGGEVRVNKVKPSNTQVGNAIGGGEANMDLFGASMSMSSDGKRLAVGAPQNMNGNGFTKAGRVVVYTPNSDNYIQLGAEIEGMAQNDGFGYSVSLSGNGDFLVVGAPSYAANPGQVFVYKYQSNQYIPLPSQPAIIGPAGDRFGYSVSMSADGRTFVVGAPDKNGFTGYVSVYNYDDIMM